MNINDDEPPTKKITGVVTQALQERDRRRQDRFFNDVVRPLIVPTVLGITGTIMAIITGAIMMWGDISTIKIQMTQLQIKISDATGNSRDNIKDQDDKMSRIEDKINRILAENTKRAKQ